MVRSKSILLIEGAGALNNDGFIVALIHFFNRSLITGLKSHLIFYWNRFHLRWGCREVLYDKSADGETYVTGLAMSRVYFYLDFV